MKTVKIQPIEPTNPQTKKVLPETNLKGLYI